MLEILQNFEQMATRFRPIVLIAPGLAAVLVGLLIWLGGLGLRKLLAALVGAVAGAILGFFIIGRNITAAAASAAIAAGIAVILERLFITILAAGLVALFAFAILARPYIENPANFKQYHERESPAQAETLTLPQTVETLKAYAANLTANIRQAASQMPAHSWAIIAALAAISLIAGAFLWRLISALCCAALGTMLIFAGIILLLCYKKAAPISSIYNKLPFYTTVFAAMIVFGTFEQLLLCPRTRKVHKKNQLNKDEERTSNQLSNWRGK